MSNDREYLSGRDKALVSSHSTGTTIEYTNEMIFGRLSPASYGKFAERFVDRNYKVMSRGIGFKVE